MHPSALLHRRSFALITVAGVLSTLAGCEGAHSQTPAQTPGAVVTAATVITRQISETQEFSGRLEAVERVEVRSRVGGYIDSVHVEPGALVHKGQLLFVIDPRPYKAETDRAEAMARAAQARADLARLELGRAERLLADRAIAQREYDERAAGVKELDAGARAAAAVADTARLNLSYTRVYAPIDGRVSKAEITVGNLIDPAAVLTSLVSVKDIYASFDGDEDTYLRVAARARAGAAVPVRVGLANETGFPHEGRLEFVDNRLDPQTGAVRLRALLTNTELSLSPGLFARVQVEGGGRAGGQATALLIDERAVGTDQSRKFVVVVGPDSRAEFRPVTLGGLDKGLRVVRSGLKPGEKIVVNGLQRVRPGAPLAPQLVAMEAPVSAATPAASLAKGG
jgi:multidrug efflux system membrane fusion protein